MLDIVNLLIQVSFYLLFKFGTPRTLFSDTIAAGALGTNWVNDFDAFVWHLEVRWTPSSCFYLVISEGQQSSRNVQSFCSCSGWLIVPRAAAFQDPFPSFLGVDRRLWRKQQKQGWHLDFGTTSEVVSEVIATLVGQFCTVLEDIPDGPTENRLFSLSNDFVSPNSLYVISTCLIYIQLFVSRTEP